MPSQNTHRGVGHIASISPFQSAIKELDLQEILLGCPAISRDITTIASIGSYRMTHPQ